MKSEERDKVRQAIIDAGKHGFRHESSDEPNAEETGSGVYTEHYRSNYDLTKITIEWDKLPDDERADM